MAGWRRSELKAGVYDEIVSARLDRQLAEFGAAFEVHRAALTLSDPIDRECHGVPPTVRARSASCAWQS